MSSGVYVCVVWRVGKSVKLFRQGFGTRRWLCEEHQSAYDSHHFRGTMTHGGVLEPLIELIGDKLCLAIQHPGALRDTITSNCIKSFAMD